MTMFRYCENLDCWKSVPICYDELCTACFRSNSWAQDIKINSNCKLLNTSNGSRFHSLSYLSIADRNTITDDDCKTFMVSYYYYLANWIIRENLANFSTLTRNCHIQLRLHLHLRQRMKLFIWPSTKNLDDPCEASQALRRQSPLTIMILIQENKRRIKIKEAVSRAITKER